MLEKLPAVFGRALSRIRPGLGKLACHRGALVTVPPLIVVTSPAFADHEPIPRDYTADGAGTSPPVDWAGIPPGTHSVALLVEDADSPTLSPLVHAIAWAIDPLADGVAEGGIGRARIARLGKTSAFRTGWMPPSPPRGHGTHRYGFEVFALDCIPDLGDAPGRRALLHALRGHVLARGLLVGTYAR
jgi:Raf kinase inhibitor-like YbhB/YbcL family protein